MSAEKQNRVLEKFYSTEELTYHLGFSVRFWRERCQEGAFTLQIDGAVIAEPVEISGELRIPASAVNAWLAKHPYRYDAGVKARNQAELHRKLEGRRQNEEAEVPA